MKVMEKVENQFMVDTLKMKTLFSNMTERSFCQWQIEGNIPMVPSFS